MTGEPKEFELKLELRDEDLSDAASAAATKRFAAAKPRRQRVLSVYYDTRKHALRDAGISLRLRHAGGRCKQTVKLGTDVHAGVSNPTEYETPVPGKKPRLDLVASKKVRKKLRKLIAGKKLKPVFRTDVLRTTHLIKSPDSEVELALDGGTIQTRQGSTAICEAELELKAGDAGDLLDIAQQLFNDIPFVLGTQSKAQRGYRLATCGQLPDQMPLKALRPPLHRTDSVAHAFSGISQSAGGQVLGNWRGILAGDDPEFAHQMRVGLRRLRTALRVFQGAIDTPAMRTLVRDLGRLGRRVGELRDADVLLTDIARPALQSCPSHAGAPELEAMLHKHGSAVRRDLRRELEQSGWNALLLQVSLLPHGAGWADAAKPGGKIGRYAPKALKTCWKPVIRRARHLSDLDTEERHTLRKDLKKLRYTLEFFAPVLPARKTQNFIGYLKGLQDSFGYLNDVALAQTLPVITTGTADETPHLSQAVHDVLDWHNRQAKDAWRNTQQQWRQLKEQPKPWA